MWERGVIQHAQDPGQTLLHGRALPLKLPDQPLHNRRAVDETAGCSKRGGRRFLHRNILVLQARIYNLPPVRYCGLGVLCLGDGDAGSDEIAGCGGDELLAARLDCG